MMDDATHEIEEEANTSKNASSRQSCITPRRQALADSMMKSVKASVSKLRPGDTLTFCKVPRIIRQEKEVAYEPQIVSIGPYHKHKEKLQAMEEHKWLYLHSFLSRNTKYKLEHYLMAMSELEDDAKSCYYDNVDLHLQVGYENFVKMMVLDACFIVEFLLRFHQPNKFFLRQKWEELKQNEEDLGLISAMDKFFFHSNGFEDPKPIRQMVILIRCDMLLLENQIPFFVLQRIFEMACPVKVPHLLEMMALYFFDGCMATTKIKIEDSYAHLLHLFHSHLIPTLTDSEEPNLSCNPKIKLKPNLSCNPKIKLKPNLSCNPKIKSVLNKYLKNLLIIFLPCSSKERREMIPCATDLQLAGIKFKKNKKSNNILNVKFSHGVLEITPFMVHYHSETLFRNLVAFEQCCYPRAKIYFTTYLMFMFFVVKTSKDVALLHHNGIIDNYYQGSDADVSNLFNRLCTGTYHSFEESYLSDLHDKVQKHCENKWNMWWASLKRDYFPNPWSVISFIAALFLLLLTTTQTFFTVFPRSHSS